MTDVRAAGAVLWRAAPGGGIELAVLHRPRHDDWSLPKGKLDPGETELEAAVREVAEETGCAVEVGAALGEVRYQVGVAEARADKVVAYWAMRATEGTFTPTREVDALRWLPPEDALAWLTYARDRELVRRFLARRATASRA